MYDGAEQDHGELTWLESVQLAKPAAAQRPVVSSPPASC
jgi:hypothetical protein